MRNRDRNLTLLAVLLASLPLLLFAYIGSFSRLITDDYGYLGKALETDAWQAMLYWRDTWSGDYTNLLLYGVLAQLGAYVPALFPLVVMLIGLAGLAWLANSLLTGLGYQRHRRAASLALAAVALAACFNGLLTFETFFWLSATVENTLPAVLLLLGIAVFVEGSRRLHSSAALAFSAIAAALAGFINAGFSEMFMVFQIVFLLLLTCALAASATIATPDRRRVALVLASAGLLGSLLSLPLQLSAPGVIYRSSQTAFMGIPLTPVRDPLQLVAQTSAEMLQYAGYQPAFGSFAMTLAAGIFAALALSRRPVASTQRANRAWHRPALRFGLLIQLVFLPVLWSHTSDNLQVLGRFSASYTVIIILNLASVAALALLLWRHRSLARLVNRRRGHLLYFAVTLAAVSVLFALAQLRSIHYRPATYLFVSALAAIIMLSWQNHATSGAAGARRLFQLASLCTAGVALTFAVIIGVSLWGQGLIILRPFASVTVLLMIAGLLWGLYLGYSFRQEVTLSAADRWLTGGRLLSALAAGVIGAGIIMGQARQVDFLAEFAAAWDANHREIIHLRDTGDPALYTAPLYISYRSLFSAEGPSMITLPIHDGVKRYYGIDVEQHAG